MLRTALFPWLIQFVYYTTGDNCAGCTAPVSRAFKYQLLINKNVAQNFLWGKQIDWWFFKVVLIYLEVVYLYFNLILILSISLVLIIFFFWSSQVKFLHWSYPGSSRFWKIRKLLKINYFIWSRDTDVVRRLKNVVLESIKHRLLEIHWKHINRDPDV